ncbi:16S rRNA processing protein RimM [Eggerthellaceae bacterium 24-137]
MRGWIDIAYLAKTKNLNGGLVARGASGLPALLYPGLEVALVPPVLDAPRRVHVERADELADNEALVTFAEVADLTCAEMLAGCRCLVHEADVDLDLLEEPEGLPDWDGWRVEDARAGLVGEVAAVDDRAMQPLLVVRRPDGSEALVPLVDEFVEAVDEDARLIRLRCPDGLLDL